MAARLSQNIVRFYPAILLAIIVACSVDSILQIDFVLWTYTPQGQRTELGFIAFFFLVWWIQFTDYDRSWRISFLWIGLLILISPLPEMPLLFWQFPFGLSLPDWNITALMLVIWFGSYARSIPRILITGALFVVAAIIIQASTPVIEFSSNERVEFPTIHKIELAQTRELLCTLITVLGISAAIALPHHSWLGFSAGNAIAMGTLILANYENLHGTQSWHLPIEREVLHPQLELVSAAPGEEYPGGWQHPVVQGELRAKGLPPDCMMTIESISAIARPPGGLPRDLSVEQPMREMFKPVGNLAEFEHELVPILQPSLPGIVIKPKTDKDRIIFLCEGSDEVRDLYSRILKGSDVDLHVIGKIYKIVPLARISLKNKSQVMLGMMKFQTSNENGNTTVNEIGYQTRTPFQEDDFAVLVDPLSKTGTIQMATGGQSFFANFFPAHSFWSTASDRSTAFLKVPVFPIEEGLQVAQLADDTFPVQKPLDQDEAMIFRPIGFEYESDLRVEATQIIPVLKTKQEEDN